MHYYSTVHFSSTYCTILFALQQLSDGAEQYLLQGSGPPDRPPALSCPAAVGDLTLLQNIAIGHFQFQGLKNNPNHRYRSTLSQLYCLAQDVSKPCFIPNLFDETLS